MTGLADWLRAATKALSSVSDTPRLDAELLAAHGLGMSREAMILSMPRLDAPPEGDALLARRLAHEPMAYITGVRDFWTLTLRVTPAVLIPRPDSETLIEAAIQFFSAPDRSEGGPRRILDLGTGSGALLLAALDHWRDATGVGIDASRAAVAVAKENAERCGMSARAEIREGDWSAAGGLATSLGERFDLILCNPPYIEQHAALAPEVRDHEPASALFAGPEGLDDYRILADQLGDFLSPGGVAIFEIGFDQADTAGELFRSRGFTVGVRRDLAGHARALMMTMN